MDKHNVLWSIFLHGNCSSSLSLLPAGGGGLSGLACVEAILQGITDHLSSTASSVLKLIYVVIQQENIFQAFVVGFRLWKLKQRVSSHTCTPVYTLYLEIYYYFYIMIPLILLVGSHREPTSNVNVCSWKSWKLIFWPWFCLLNTSFKSVVLKLFHIKYPNITIFGRRPPSIKRLFQRRPETGISVTKVSFEKYITIFKDFS